MEVLKWLKSDGFDAVCDASGTDWDRAMSAFEWLHRYDFPLRKNMMKATISGTLGAARVEKERAEED